VVIDRDVHVLPADRLARATRGVEPAPVRVALDAAGDALAGTALDATKLLDVDVDELARARTLVATRGLEAEPARRPSPSRVRIPETVERAIASVSAISAALMRSCRSATIACTRSARVRLATLFGAEERSSRPRSPSRR
jgi:hypothetical protein